MVFVVMYCLADASWPQFPDEVGCIAELDTESKPLHDIDHADCKCSRQGLYCGTAILCFCSHLCGLSCSGLKIYMA